MSVTSESISSPGNSPASITTAGLIALSQKSRTLSLKSGMISAVQSGDYQSAFKGRGMEYNESRLYQAGDDIRNIDWRVTARTGKAHTKLFCEERERPVHIWVDFRAPMFFATRGKFKSVMAAELASLFAWTANRQGDRVGGVVFSDSIHHELKPQRGKSAVLRLIKHMVEHPAWQQTDIHENQRQGMLHSLINLRRMARPGSLVILLSDFRGFDEESRSHLIRLRQHNELIMVHIYDWLEEFLPPAGNYRIRNGEQELEFDTNNKKLIADHANKFKSHQQYLIKTARSCHANFLSCRTEDNAEQIIKHGLRSR
ncbi:MAG TPA: DUF58 domain-containing protein [Thiotrichaceae bacterium]|jgi:uncharacterized protein (DUF58 family)|nr:DUF58 domain-containing protein [Thiotrichaceae bacterium]HIM07015.1 DUF58 domain-containing protein [Gammaproteobacteria bacterium]